MMQSARTAVAAVEKALYRAMIDADMPALGNLLEPDLVYIHSDGVRESRHRYLARVKKGYYAYARIRSRKVTTSTAGAQAVMCGLVSMDVATDGGKVLKVNLHSTLVWQDRDDRWQLTLRQATRIP